MKCDMCGSVGKLYEAIIEDAELKVCHECSKFGKVIGIVKQEEPNKTKSEEPKTEIMNIVVDDYAEKIRKKRESLGLNQKEFAKKISEKESLIQKIESGHFDPSIGLAKKISGLLKIKLIEEYEEKHEPQSRTKTDAFTIGDLIKTKSK